MSTVSKTTATLDKARGFYADNWNVSTPTVQNLADFADSLTAELQKENAKLAAGLRKWELALQSLTPGGSEYVGDPERCAACVRRSTESRWEFTKKTKIERDELQKENARLREALVGVRECPQCGALCELHAELSFEALNPPKGGEVQKGLSKEKAKEEKHA